MSRINFYSDIDLQQIDDNLNNIETNAIKIKYQTLDPTNDEYIKVKKIIVDFLIEQKRVVYGGSAYHAIIQHYRKDKNSDKRIYPDWERFDIEFYSPRPIRDLVMICNRLSDTEIKYVIGRQAQHDETFTVFANFLQYCDMSYMPESIFDKIQYIEIDGLRYIHPEYILIDIFRMYNDPITSAWRFSKVFKRMKLLMEHFPFDFVEAKPIIFPSNDDNNIIEYIVPKLVASSTFGTNLVFVGQLPYLVYTNPNKSINSNQFNQIEIVTDQLEEVVNFITNLTYKWLSKNKKNEFHKYNEYFKTSNYSRFFQYWDNRTIISYCDKPLFTIIGNANRCIPTIDSKINLNNKEYPIKIGTFLVIFNYFFIGYHYEQINKLGFYFADRNLINSLLTSKNNYLKSNNKTVIDTSLFQEFVLSCIGKTTEFTREYLLRMSEKRARGEKILMSYDPNIARGTFIEHEFEQADGLVIS